MRKNGLSVATGFKGSSGVSWSTTAWHRRVRPLVNRLREPFTFRYTAVSAVGKHKEFFQEIPAMSDMLFYSLFINYLRNSS